MIGLTAYVIPEHCGQGADLTTACQSLGGLDDALESDLEANPNQ
jgi:hypothetical protein